MTVGIEEIKSLPMYYQALGFERLPITIITQEKVQATSNTQRSEKEPSRITGRALPDKAAELDALRDMIGDCQRCKLARHRTNLVFGTGNPDGVPCVLGANGVEKIIQFKLDQEEQAMMEKSVAAVKSLVDTLK